MLAEQGAAPALLFRKQRSGRPRVTVLANYVAAPFSGLVGTGGSKAKAKRPRGGRSSHPVLKAMVPRSKIAAVERRKARASRVGRASAEAARWRRTSKEAPIGAPLPHFGEGRKWKEGSAAPQVRGR